MIISRLDEEVRIEKDPMMCRAAYEWLMIEKSYKGEKWYIESIIDKGMVMITGEDGKSWWVYESNFEITLDEKIYNRTWYCSENKPRYVKMLDHNKSGVPAIVKRLYDEVYPKVTEEVVNA